MDRESIFRSGAAGKSSHSSAYGIIFRRSMGGKEAGGRVRRDPKQVLQRSSNFIHAVLSVTVLSPPPKWMWLPHLDRSGQVALPTP